LLTAHFIDIDMIDDMHLSQLTLSAGYVTREPSDFSFTRGNI
jgi:hypothetical protein